MLKLKNNKFLVLLIALLAFFILVFFTKNIYIWMQENIIENDSKIEKIESLNTKLDKLNKLKNDLDDKDKEITKELNKFMWEFSEDKLILHINDYIEQTNNTSGEIVLFLENMSFSEPAKSELWFKKVDINLNLKVSNKHVLKNLLDYLISTDSDYSFFITNFSFPIEKSGPYKINIPLQMYIK